MYIDTKNISNVLPVAAPRCQSCGALIVLIVRLLRGRWALDPRLKHVYSCPSAPGLLLLHPVWRPVRPPPPMQSQAPCPNCPHLAESWSTDSSLSEGPGAVCGGARASLRIVPYRICCGSPMENPQNDQVCRKNKADSPILESQR